MFATTFKRLLGRAALALSLALSANAALADVILSVNIDTANFGSSGFLDFQFSGPGAGEPPATATMSNLSGFDLSKFVLDGQVAAVPGSFVFGNAPGFNAALYEANFGGVFSFTLTFAGDVIDTVSSTFSIQAWDSALSGPAGNLTDPLLLTLDWSLAPTGAPAVTAAVFDSSVGATAVPEPSSMAIAALGLGLLGFVRRKRAA